MAKTSPTEFDLRTLHDRVSDTYTRLVREPAGTFHFNHGLDYACELLGYERNELESLPEACTRRFAGLGNPHRIGPIEPGETVLDIGCGAGMDLLLSARRTGPGGKVIGIDPTPAMRECASSCAREADVSEIVDIRDGRVDALPVDDASIDVVTSNGVLNLAPDKHVAFREIARVMRPGARLYLADVAIDEELSLKSRSDANLWAA
ncbi:MAG TPA: methyltransferase domain-containing protein [Candidatus Polarisedimenticolia bacterium]|nr:methyltransferase domain-containing protein [Candidatus Polarisedimenticolia bacterium]